MSLPKLIPLFTWRDEIKSKRRRVVVSLRGGVSALMELLCAASIGSKVAKSDW